MRIRKIGISPSLPLLIGLLVIVLYSTLSTLRPDSSTKAATPTSSASSYSHSPLMHTDEPSATTTVTPAPIPAHPELPAPPLVAPAPIASHPQLFNAPPPKSHPAPITPTGIYLPAPAIQQAYPLDCESAALQVALATKGYNLSQQQIFSQLPDDTTPAQLSNGQPVRWGNPYTSFVGNVYGSESRFTGYGVYSSPIAAVARQVGAVANEHSGWTVASIEEQIRQGNPVVVWVNNNFSATSVRYWTAWDGQRIPYTTLEHAVTVVGFDSGKHTITIVDVAVGKLHTFSEGAFDNALLTFGGMGIAISNPTPTPPPTPTPSPTSPPSPSPSSTPTATPTPSPSASPTPTPTATVSPTPSGTPSPSPASSPSP